MDAARRDRCGPGPFDAALVAGLWLLSVSVIIGLVDGAGRQVVAAGLAFAHIAPLAWRRRHPEGVLLAMATTGLAFVATGSSVVCLGPAVLVAVYAVAAYRPPRRSLATVGAATAAMTVAVGASGARFDTVAADTIAFAVAWLVGDRQRRAVADAAAERARAVELTRTREQLARQAVIEERLRIARELHDIVAHAMSVTTVQAGTARMVMDSSPDVAVRHSRPSKGRAVRRWPRCGGSCPCCATTTPDRMSFSARPRGWPISTAWWPSPPRRGCGSI